MVLHLCCCVVNHVSVLEFPVLTVTFDLHIKSVSVGRAIFINGWIKMSLVSLLMSMIFFVKRTNG